MALLPSLSNLPFAINKKVLLIGAGVLALLVLIVLAVVFTGGGSNGNPTDDPGQDCLPGDICDSNGGNTDNKNAADITIWAPYDDNATLKPIIEGFQEQYLGANITFVKKSPAEYESELVDAIASGQGPDLFAIHNNWLPKHKGKISALPKELLSLESFSEAFAPVVYDDFVDDNKIYGIPAYTDNLALLYNKSQFSKAEIQDAPTTWEDIVSYSNILTQTTPGDPTKIARAGIAMGLPDNINRSGDILLSIMLQKKAPIVSRDKKSFTFNQSVLGPDGVPIYPGAEALGFYTSFANPNKISYSWSKNMEDSISAFANERASMIITYSYNIPTIRRINPNLNFGIAPMPQIKGSLDSATVASYWGWSVSRNSRSKETAWNFALYMTDLLGKNSNVQRQYLNSMERTTSKRTDDESTSGMGVFAGQVMESKSIFKCNNEDFDNIFLEMIRGVSEYGQSPQQAIDSAARQANEMLKKKCP